MNPILCNRIIFVLSLAGVAVSGYLTLAHANVVDLGCGAIHGCNEVALHDSAHGFGIPALKAIPTAAFGLMAYIAMVVLSFLRVAAASESVSLRARDLQWTLAFVSLLVSAYLTYLEAYVIHAWCQWCLISAALVVLIFLTATAERFAPVPPLTQGEPS